MRSTDTFPYFGRLLFVPFRRHIQSCQLAAMATLREFQIALQEKIEQLRQRDDIIYDLETELAEKDAIIDRLQFELGRIRCLLSGGNVNSPGVASSTNGSYRLQPSGASPTTSGTSSPSSSAYYMSSIPHRFRFPPAIHVAGAPQPTSSTTSLLRSVISENASDPSSAETSLASTNSASAGAKKTSLTLHKEVGKRMKSVSVVDQQYRPPPVYQQAVSRTKSCK